MASLEQRNGIYRIVFRYQGKRHSHSLGTTDSTSATTAKANVEQRLSLIKTNVLPPPDSATNLAIFLLHGKSIPIGPAIEEPVPASRQQFTFEQVAEQYFSDFLKSSIEPASFRMLEIHKKHLLRHLGRRTTMKSIKSSFAQSYINKRAKDPGIRGEKISPVTIKKEVTTLNSILRWAKSEGMIEQNVVNKKLRYPKGKEKPPFQTLQEIATKVKRDDLNQHEESALWDCLFLSTNEITELLDDVSQYARHSFIHPMFAFAAYTGARRSEILRSQLDDIDLKQRRITIREKKRVRGKTSTRTVPITNSLYTPLKAWIANHPGGNFTFRISEMIYRSRKVRSKRDSITPDEAHDHFKQTLKGTKWERIRGWHCLRHSFCSNCAAAGVEQRVINTWVGHQTPEMVRRYRHLFPSREIEAIESVFG